ncbi:hypothetical protein MUK70_00335 [Dyadobacter chenwenxiniae]|uniref:Uncharacterized protein n=1 Tax=Dyadobacter chenwenxiniae TaxID=2906456 RepID=A0A9X1PMR1_9BACT|nr:hypothetical protein [Dyadobacter chenwenxiniae]MCF0063773.1 hypothetical protein [Dyadobacter chenwenxiniae]UON83449.1 hypothetical protein MUK70_00335 [Dyadobacter chenwenxiniae]
MMLTTILKVFILNLIIHAAPFGKIDQQLAFQFMGEQSINKGDCEVTGCIRLETDKLLIRGNQTGNRYIEIYLDGPAAPGDYKITSQNRIELGRGRSKGNQIFESVYYKCSGCDATYPAGSITITRAEGPGGYVEGTFKTLLSEKGVWKDQVPIEGSFKVYRER